MARKSEQQRRDQIVGGMLSVMAKRGYERASIAAIAKEAGLATGLVHYYFKSKQEILLALMGHLAEGLESRYELRLETAEDDPWARLEAFVDAYVGLGDDAAPEAVACWVAVGSEAMFLPEVRVAYEKIAGHTMEQLKLHLMEVLVTEGRRSEGIHGMAAGIFAAIEGAYKLATSSRGLVPEGFAAPTIKTMARGLLDAQPLRDG